MVEEEEEEEEREREAHSAGETFQPMLLGKLHTHGDVRNWRQVIYRRLQLVQKETFATYTPWIWG